LSERGGRDELVRSDERARCTGRAWCQKKAPERTAADQRTTASIGCESSRERRRERWQGREEEKSEPLSAFETSVLWRATRAASREGGRECDEVARNAKEARRASRGEEEDVPKSCREWCGQEALVGMCRVGGKVYTKCESEGKEGKAKRTTSEE
jgi:hypothetical protein